MTMEDRRAKAFQMIDEMKKGQRTFDKETHDLLMSVLVEGTSTVSVKVVSQKGFCMAGHKVGDEWLMKREDGWRKPPQICILALQTLMPTLQVLMYGGSFPWERDPDCAGGTCPDSRNPVVFEVRRLSQS